MQPTTVGLAELDADQLEVLAHVTFAAAREHSPVWMPDLDAARGELTDAREPQKIGRVLLDATGQPIAWVTAVPDWGDVWELNPLIVGIEHQGSGHGQRLVSEIEQLVAARGARTMTAFTSDTIGATSLADCDLYDNTFARLAAVEIRRPHALGFLQHVGYRIVGVVPDAEGPGKPSIALARRL